MRWACGGTRERGGGRWAGGREGGQGGRDSRKGRGLGLGRSAGRARVGGTEDRKRGGPVFEHLVEFDLCRRCYLGCAARAKTGLWKVARPRLL